MPVPRSQARITSASKSRVPMQLVVDKNERVNTNTKVVSKHKRQTKPCYVTHPRSGSTTRRPFATNAKRLAITLYTAMASDHVCKQLFSVVFNLSGDRHSATYSFTDRYVATRFAMRLSLAASFRHSIVAELQRSIEHETKYEHSNALMYREFGRVTLIVWSLGFRNVALPGDFARICEDKI